MNLTADIVNWPITFVFTVVREAILLFILWIRFVISIVEKIRPVTLALSYFYLTAVRNNLIFS